MVKNGHRDLGVTDERLSHEMGFWNVEGSSAYAVISAPPGPVFEEALCEVEEVQNCGVSWF